MQVHDFFWQLAILLVVARLFAEAATWLRTPAVIGELLAGLMLGPSLLGWMEPNEVIRMLAEIGVLLLLFEVGLESDPSRLAKSGGPATRTAILGFVVPFLLGYLVAREMFGYEETVALFVGGTLTATSIGITLRVLRDLHRQHSEEAQVVLGAAVLDDIFGVVLLAVLLEFASSGQVSWATTARVLGLMGLFLLLSPIIAQGLSRLIRAVDSRTSLDGLIPTAIMALILALAWGAHAMGAPELLGGFAAGLALSRRFFLPFGLALHHDETFTERIEYDMKPIIRLFTPIFFVMVGLSLDLRAIDWSEATIWTLSLALLVVAVAGKLISGQMIRAPQWFRFAVGISMLPRGEVGLIFAELGRLSGILNAEAHAALVIVIALTTLLGPFVLKLFYQRMEHKLSGSSGP